MANRGGGKCVFPRQISRVCHRLQGAFLGAQLTALFDGRQLLAAKVGARGACLCRRSSQNFFPEGVHTAFVVDHNEVAPVAFGQRQSFVGKGGGEAAANRHTLAGLSLRQVTMNLTVQIPDDLAGQMNAAGGDLSRRALEALALEEYKSERISKAQLRRLLGIETRYKLDGFLKERGVFIDCTIEDLNRQVETLRRLGL